MNQLPQSHAPVGGKIAISMKIDTALLERILKLSKRDYDLFLALGQGLEFPEIVQRLNKKECTVYQMVKRLRPKLGIKTNAMLRFEATRYVLSGIKRQERQFVFVQDESAAA